MEKESTSVESVYALVEDGIVINTIIWDGDSSSWQPPSGQVTVPVSDDEQVVSIGWLYDGIRFIEPGGSGAR